MSTINHTKPCTKYAKILTKATTKPAITLWVLEAPSTEREGSSSQVLFCKLVMAKWSNHCKRLGCVKFPGRWQSMDGNRVAQVGTHVSCSQIGTLQYLGGVMLIGSYFGYPDKEYWVHYAPPISNRSFIIKAPLYSGYHSTHMYIGVFRDHRGSLVHNGTRQLQIESTCQYETKGLTINPAAQPIQALGYQIESSTTGLLGILKADHLQSSVQIQYPNPSPIGLVPILKGTKSLYSTIPYNQSLSPQPTIPNQTPLTNPLYGPITILYTTTTKTIGPTQYKYHLSKWVFYTNPIKIPNQSFPTNQPKLSINKHTSNKTQLLQMPPPQPISGQIKSRIPYTGMQCFLYPTRSPKPSKYQPYPMGSQSIKPCWESPSNRTPKTLNHTWHLAVKVDRSKIKNQVLSPIGLQSHRGHQVDYPQSHVKSTTHSPPNKLLTHDTSQVGVCTPKGRGYQEAICRAKIEDRPKSGSPAAIPHKTLPIKPIKQMVGHSCYAPVLKITYI
ncbi:hypothetical protein G9A89_000694 [Geosiphon pyriformis]|nr:hypothetical protein G9A89_000694 [Geosiphon pyriformis]